MWFHAIAIGPVAAGRGDRHHVLDAVGPLERDLERDHPAQRTAGDDGPTLDAERVGEGPQRPGLVAGGDGRERWRPTARPVTGSIDVGPVEP